MPSTRKQMRAAGRELRLRREGKAQQEQVLGRGTRPFGAASTKTLRAYAEWPDPGEQRVAATRELRLRKAGGTHRNNPNAAFAKASMKELEFFANASDAAIRKRNGQT